MKGWKMPAPMSSETPVVAAQNDSILPAFMPVPRPHGGPRGRILSLQGSERVTPSCQVAHSPCGFCR